MKATLLLALLAAPAMAQNSDLAVLLGWSPERIWRPDAGAGLDFRLNRRWTLRGEFRNFISQRNNVNVQLGFALTSSRNWTRRSVAKWLSRTSRGDRTLLDRSLANVRNSTSP